MMHQRRSNRILGTLLVLLLAVGSALSASAQPGGYGPGHPAFPIFGEGVPGADLARATKPWEKGADGQVIRNPNVFTTDFTRSNPMPSRALVPPLGFQAIWAIFADPDSPTGLRGAIGFESLDKKQALGHPNLLPGFTALSAGEVDIKNGTLRFNNLSGRVMLRPEVDGRFLKLSDYLWRGALQDTRGKLLLEPDYRYAQGWGMNNYFSNPDVSPEQDADLQRIASNICRSTERSKGSSEQPLATKPEPVSQPALLPGGRLNRVVGNAIGNAPILADQAMLGATFAGVSLGLGFETYQKAIGNSSVGEKALTVPLGTGATLATGGTAVMYGGTMLQTVGMAQSGAALLAGGAVAAKGGLITLAITGSAATGYTAGRAIDYASGGRITDSVAFLFTLPMDLFNSACDGKLDFSTTSTCYNNFGTQSEWSWW